MSKKNSVLVVDDEDSIRTTINAILEDEGYKVDLAATGKEAIEKSTAQFYNVMLLDIRLPDMEGIELLKKLRTDIPRTRKIMVTGFPSLQNTIEALNKGADAYLVKPVDVEELLKVVREQIEKQVGEQEFSELKVSEFIESRIKDI